MRTIDDTTPNNRHIAFKGQPAHSGLQQAQQALHTQQARYEACGDLQMMERG